MMQASWVCVLYAGDTGEVGDGVSDAQRRWEHDAADPLAEDEDVSMECRDVQEEDSDI